MDGEGRVIGNVKQGIGYISDCHPIVVNGRLIWYVYNSSKTVFFELNSDTFELKQEDGRETGDTNGDGNADIADVLMISRFDAELITLASFEKKVSDINKDDSIDIADALIIARYDAGLINSLIYTRHLKY